MGAIVKEKTTVLNMAVPTDVLDALSLIADKQGLSRAQLIRKALKEYAQAHKDEKDT